MGLTVAFLSASLNFSRRAARVLFVFFFCLFFSSQSFALGSGPEVSEFPVAMRTFGVWLEEGRERFDFAVWYPGGSGGSGQTREGRIIPAAGGGKIIPGFYPVILLSHDTAGSRFFSADTAVSLASKGFIVIAVSHSGDNQNDSSDVFTAKSLRSRPRELLLALDTLLGNPDFALSADESRIGVLGVGFGAVTALQLAGGEPDFSRLKEFCASAPPEETYCSSWAGDKMTRVSADIASMRHRFGPGFLTPPLNLYAPALVQAPPPPPPPVEKAPKAPPPQEEKADLGFFQRLFGEHGDTSATEAETAAAQSAAPEAPAEGPALEFQGGPLFGGTDSGAPFVYIALSDSPDFRMVLTDDNAGTAAAPVPQTAHPVGPPAHRRDPSVRKIRAVALLVPAGGMLYTQKNFPPLPLAVVEAENDTLYSPALHAAPLVAAASGRAEVISLPGVDHQALLAQCSNEMAADLAGGCGRVADEERNAAVQARDLFLGTFFRAALGAALPQPVPSEMIAGAPLKAADLNKPPPPKEPEPPKPAPKPTRNRAAAG